MASGDKNTRRLYKDIRDDFLKKKNIKEFDVQKYTNEWIYRKLADKYYRSWRTIENIIYHRVKK